LNNLYTYYFKILFTTFFLVLFVNCSKEDLTDSDGDGVMDSVDTCPNTPSYERIGVDNNGCSSSQRDSDGDGVMDDVDKCPNTPSGENVGERGCKIIIDDGEGIIIEFVDGLNDVEEFKFPKDSNGYYYLTLDGYGQTERRVTVKLSRNGDPVYSLDSGYRHTLRWSSNLFWWLLPGDIVVNITQTYFNPYTGEFQYINLPPIVNWEEQLVPTINSTSITDEVTGISNSVIGPIQEMLGDTLMIKVQYVHLITKKEEGSMFFESIGERVIKDSVQVILK